MTHMQNVDGQGQLLIGDRVSPITYHVAVERHGEGYSAKVAIQAPRDWLLRQGFEKRATLVFASGERVELEHEGPLDVSESISIVLQAEAQNYRDRQRLIKAFPEVEGGVD